LHQLIHLQQASTAIASIALYTSGCVGNVLIDALTPVVEWPSGGTARSRINKSPGLMQKYREISGGKAQNNQSDDLDLIFEPGLFYRESAVLATVAFSAHNHLSIVRNTYVRATRPGVTPNKISLGLIRNPT
jgi:hypothetical protein